MKRPVRRGNLCTISTSVVKKVPFNYLPVMIISLATENQTTQYCMQGGTLKGIYNKEELFYCIQRNTQERYPNLFRRIITFHETCHEFMIVISCNCK
jgi:hypothetical protein